MIDFNLNERVYVKLNDIGIAELKRQHDELRAYCSIGEFVPPETDDEGWTKFQLHTLMNKFGHLVRMGVSLPFETDIRIDANNA